MTAAASMSRAYAACEQLARVHYENFSLGTRLLPRRLRPHFYSLYAFCRGVDDLGDEVSGDRLAQLDEWQRQLWLCYSGAPQHPYFIALQTTIREFDLPEEPFNKLIEANRRDQTIKRHGTYAQLLDYCDHSANPVGRLVLRIFGHRDPELDELSDHTCTALQLTNFWQDVARDYATGRVYIPREDMERFGVREADLGADTAGRALRDLLRFEVERTRDLFRSGAPLVQRLVRFARLDVALFTAGGLSILRSIERQGYDVLSNRPVLSKTAKGGLFIIALLRFGLGLNPLPGRVAHG